MLQLLQKNPRILNLLSITTKPILQILPIPANAHRTHPQILAAALTLSRNNQFERISIAEDNSIQMKDFGFLGGYLPVDEEFGLGFGKDEDLAFLVQDGAVALWDAQRV